MQFQNNKKIEQKKLLAWSDAASVGTGFGVVSKHVLGSLYMTGRYDIHHLAINFHGDFVDRNVVPWTMQPARLLDPQDPYGLKMFYRTLTKQHYDYVWILNDLFVTHDAAQAIIKVRDKYKSNGTQAPIFVNYYPVDCHVRMEATGMLDVADINVCYTDHGKVETLLVKPEVKNKLVQIPHGVDSRAFRPLSTAERLSWKEKYFKLRADQPLVVSVNRNSVRKQIPYSLLAFKEFKKKVPDAVFYIHTQMKDVGSDLSIAIEDAGLKLNEDVLLPKNYTPTNAVSDEVLNRIYNCSDLFLTTHLGEGWGLTITEAMAAGIPVVAPNNTCMPQQLGENSERGYMYPCTDSTWVDNSGFRPKGSIPDIADAMYKAYTDMQAGDKSRVDQALAWARQHDWYHVCDNWVQLFDSLEDYHVEQDITEEI